MKIVNFKLETPKVKLFHFSFFTFYFTLLLLSGCMAFQVGGEIQGGRMALMYGDPKVALAHFQRAGELDPNYITNFTVFQEGVWTYVGRANYAAGKFTDARQALERALSRYEDDYLARLYLGLLLGRDGDPQRGLKEIEAGLKGLGDWLDYIDYYTHVGRYWDPTKKIRAEARRNLAMISGREMNWQELTRNVEWIGEQIEQEIDRASKDELQERDRDSSDSDHQP